MLRSLHIENIAVIRRADVDFRNGLSVLTGETGAGKSMIIDSINLLLGNRPQREMIRSGEKQATVSAIFEELSPRVCEELAALGFPCEDASLMIQRTVNADGRSQARLNGQPITQAMQRTVTPLLINIHGQMDSHRLLQKSFHLEFLDDYAKNDAALTQYKEAFAAYKDNQRKLEATSGNLAEKIRLEEMLKFQIEDIDSVKLKAGEEEALEKERDRLANLEKINRQVSLAHRCLSGGEKGNAVELLRRARNAISSLSGIVDGAEELLDRLSNAESEILDVSETVASYAEDDREDPTARIDKIEARLEKIARLKRKYGESVEEILAFRAHAQEELDSLDLSGEFREKLKKEGKILYAQAKKIADELHALRAAAAEKIRIEVTDALRFLDMPKVRMEVRLTPCELSERGGDGVEFLIATNPGEPVRPLDKIASGGELSRMMLALRSVLDDREGATTVIFDEIDTGVSGKTSRKIGLKLLQTANNTQVLCVTHSAQIASLADTHYLITKQERDGRAHTEVLELSDEERVEEIARILGGIEVTEAQRDAAREMIAEYRKDGTL